MTSPRQSVGAQNAPHPTNSMAQVPQGRQRLRFRPITALELTKLALAIKSQTLVEATRVLRGFGVAARREVAQQVLERREEIDEVRSKRRAKRPVAQPNLQRRLFRYKAAKIMPVAQSLFRYGAAGGNSFKLWFVEKGTDVKYEVVLESNWDTYRGRFKGWHATEDHHRIHVPRDWGVRVLAQNLADLDGMLTLDAHRLISPEGVSLYAATWAAQGRGYSVVTHRGFIAVADGVSFHADTLERALSGIRRKVRAASRPIWERQSPLQIAVDLFVRRYQRYDVTVRLDDARESGSCEYGIRCWCEAVGLDYEQGEAPLADVLRAFQKRPQLEVRLAVLQAIRRYRSGKRRAG